jgi:hypothetical protein
MVDQIRRKILKTGAAATVMAAASVWSADWTRRSCYVVLRKRSRSHSI